MYRNAGAGVLVFRDDAGKHFVAPGEPFDVVGAQHRPMVEAIPGVVLAAAGPLSVEPVRRQPRRKR
jgi:hypothetical protein